MPPSLQLVARSRVIVATEEGKRSILVGLQGLEMWVTPRDPRVPILQWELRDAKIFHDLLLKPGKYEG